jgi:hypothetical protein
MECTSTTSSEAPLRCSFGFNPVKLSKAALAEQQQQQVFGQKQQQQQQRASPLLKGQQGFAAATPEPIVITTSVSNTVSSTRSSGLGTPALSFSGHATKMCHRQKYGTIQVSLHWG